MEYDCVYEMNPLLPEIPHRDRLILHKATFLHPFIFLYEENMLDYRSMIFPLWMGAFVVHNNLEVIDRAEKNCQKR